LEPVEILLLLKVVSCIFAMVVETMSAAQSRDHQLNADCMSRIVDLLQVSRWITMLQFTLTHHDRNEYLSKLRFKNN
jgi:hypothetical protein